MEGVTFRKMAIKDLQARQGQVDLIAEVTEKGDIREEEGVPKQTEELQGNSPDKDIEAGDSQGVKGKDRRTSGEKTRVSKARATQY